MKHPKTNVAEWYKAAGNEEKIEFTNWLKSALASAPATVTFRKADGTVRTMKCTRNPEEVPTSIIDSSDQTCVVWDLDKSDWRSFRFDTVFSVEVSE